ncbi:MULTISPECIES: VOC family protein [Nocardiopsis]|uniref:VOC family protein n=2 Tax=Nocardiopsis alba TaxID=53437 RepID=A0ABV5E0J6_9ACTN|nr:MULTISPECIES: VOC family protein [Nocardiopsis]AFR07585.1 glyoxalase/Bleomycin resistance /Dioxygenase superfamily protein [Nocardiopsis alba ATCC BAA-2165]MEC3892040.1 VOC family protein [Nocardiopsis sp. LDBS1602]
MTRIAPRTGHVGLNVTDIERSRDFYTRVFGFDVLGEGKEEGREYAFLGSDGQLILTLWKQSGEAFRKDTAGLHHLSFQVETVEEVRRAEADLREIAVDFAYDGVVPHGEGAASGGIFFHDPDGIRLEIYAPTGADEAEAPVAAAPTCGFF